MANILTKFFKGLLLRGESSDISDNLEGSIFHNTSDSRLKTYIEGAIREFVTNSQNQALTNKTIEVNNNTVVTTAVGNLSSTELNAALNELQVDIDTRVTGPASSVDTQLARFDGTTGKVLDTVSGSTLSDTGILTSSQLIATQALVTGNTIAFSGSTTNTSTGVNVLLPANSNARLRLTGVGLGSIGGIASPTSGRLFLLSNETGASVIINHEDLLIATPSNRFCTPDGLPYILPNNSMVWYMYTSTINRYVLISSPTTTFSVYRGFEIFNTIVTKGSSDTSVTGVLHFKAPKNLTISYVQVQIFEKGSTSSGSLTIDVKKNTSPDNVGMTSLFSTLPTFNFSTISDYATSTGTLSVTSVSEGDYLRLDITTVPATFTGSFQIIMYA
jgi:hypothetical protein